MKGEYRDHKKSKKCRIFNFDPLKFWREHSKRYPFLCKVVRRYLTCTSSSTVTEDVFSEASNNYIQRRKTSVPEMMPAMIIGRNNIRQEGKLWVTDIHCKYTLDDFNNIWQQRKDTSSGDYQNSFFKNSSLYELYGQCQKVNAIEIIPKRNFKGSIKRKKEARIGCLRQLNYHLQAQQTSSP